MAYSGRINGTTSNSSIKCYISYTCISSTKYNNTEVRATLYYSRTDGYVTYGTWSGSITINGNKKTGSTSIQLNGLNTVAVLSHTVVVPHNADGTRKVTISATGAASGTTLTSTNLSKQITLETIPRQATLTAAPNFNDEGNPIITYSNPAGTAVTTLQACIADSNGEVIHVPYRDISKSGTTYTFNLTETERKTLRQAYKTANSNTVKFYIKTIIGGTTLYSSLAKTFSIINAAPSLNPTAIDVDAAMTALTGDNNKIVRYYSDIQYAANAAAVKEATIKSYKITCGSLSSTTATGKFDNVSSGSIVFSVTDSRGNTTTKTINKTFIEYIKPSCVMEVEAPTTEGTLTIKASGNYYNGSIGATANALTTQYRYSTDGGQNYTAWAAMTATLDGHTYTAAANLTGLDYRLSYRFQTRAVDKIGSANSAAKTVKTTPIFDWSENDFNFNVPVTITDNSSTYNLIGLARAITTTYSLETTITAGTNYTSATTSNAVLIGNSIRCHFNVTRNSATGAGNIANETIARLRITHNGKIKALYSTCFGNGTAGGLGQFYISNATNDGYSVEFDVVLAATSEAGTAFQSYFTLPCIIDLNYY